MGHRQKREVSRKPRPGWKAGTLIVIALAVIAPVAFVIYSRQTARDAKKTGAESGSKTSPTGGQPAAQKQTARREPVGTPVTPVDKADTTLAVALEEPYENPIHQQVRFGERSYYLMPWRAYMDTHPASQYLRILGCVFNGVGADDADAVAEILAGAGIHQVRIEIGWGNCEFDHPDRLRNEKEMLAKLRAVKKHGIRPLILLNANSGWPCPIREIRVQLQADGKAGARQIVLDKTSEIVIGKTGLRDQAYPIAYPLITGVDAASGRCTLSAPLAKDVKKGPLRLYILKYAPFGGAAFEDGASNRTCQETFDGWMKYVAGITRVCKNGLGTEGAADAGFDLEVWNEYTFGSQFLDEKNYYDPDRSFKESYVYRKHKREMKGHESILAMTVDYANDPANDCRGVRVINGFSNQRPWDSGSGLWPGQFAFSRHYYTGTDVRKIDRAWHIRKRTEKIDGPLNALGLRDGKLDGRDWNTIHVNTLFVPSHDMALPEYWHHAYQTEFITREVQPFPGPWREHHRFSHNGDGRIAEVWRTETNFWRSPMGGRLQKDHGADKKDPRYAALLHHIGAKSLLRMYVFRSHKGESTNTIYNAKARDDGFGVIPQAFHDALKKNEYKLTDNVRALRGEQLETIERTTKLMRTGVRIDAPRKLAIDTLVERKPRLVFKGDGSKERPNYYNRHIFACLPFQLAADRFAIAYYVVTRNAVKAYDTNKDALDPARYAMPPQEFDITLSNIRGRGATLRVFDSLTGRDVAVRKLAGDGTTLTVRVKAVDYPRFLLVDESRPGPTIERPRIHVGDGSPKLTFATNVEAGATVTWGPFPYRIAAATGVVKGEYYEGRNFERLLRKHTVSSIDYSGGSPAPDVGDHDFSVRWTGKVKPKKSGRYTFITVSDDGVRLWVEGKKRIENWTDHGAVEDSATVELSAGKEYAVKMEYYQGGGEGVAKLLWSGPGISRQPVRFLAPDVDGQPKEIKELSPGRAHEVVLTGAGERDAARITVEKDGLICTWPMWDWDVQGVLGFAPAVAEAAKRRSAISWPELPEGNRPINWRRIAGGSQRNRVSVRHVNGSLEQVEALLPTLSVSDRKSIKPFVWQGVAAWRVDLELDPAAHPGMVDVRQVWCVARMREGYLVLSIKGTAETIRAEDNQVERVMSSVVFE